MINPIFFRIIVLTVFFLLPLSACDDPADLQGSYRAEAPLGTEAIPIKLVLSLNGQGFWSRGDESVFFKWEIKNNKIWLHTKSGSIISGTILTADRIEILLPGAGMIAFLKVKK